MHNKFMNTYSVWGNECKAIVENLLQTHCRECNQMS